MEDFDKSYKAKIEIEVNGFSFFTILEINPKEDCSILTEKDWKSFSEQTRQEWLEDIIYNKVDVEVTLLK